MRIIIKTALCFVVLMITYLVIYWNIFAPIAGPKRIAYIPIIISLIIALVVAIIAWRNMGNFANSLFAYVVGCGIAVGFIGFILGFYGPLLLSPSNNLGPLLGVFITGPAGFFLGLFIGGLHWNTKVKTKKVKEVK